MIPIDRLQGIIYLGRVAPVAQLNDGEIAAVAVTNEGNGYMVWYGHADHGDVAFHPIGEDGFFTDDGAREKALERGVTACLKAHARHQKRVYST